MHRVRGHRFLLALMAFAMLFNSSAKAWAADDPAVTGVWHGVMTWPDKAVHAIVLHTGKVLWFRGDTNGPSSFTWDPVTNEMRQQQMNIPLGVFCSGHSLLPDGRVLVEGGQLGTSGSLGPKFTIFFDPVTETWTRGPDMAAGRYYPSNVVLGDGRTLVFSGLDETHTINETVESFLPGTGPGGSDQWEILPNANHYMGYYPRIHLLPSGLLFRVAKDPESELLNPATGVWTQGPVSNYGGRREGTSFLVPPSLTKVCIVGGGSSTNTAEVIDMAAPNPAWTYTGSMTHGRIHLNAVVLPDATVLVSGGETGSTPVLPAEIYNPATGTWRVVASMNTWRRYHSSAVLLPDGRCLWAGSDGNETAEVYSPPYLFKGPRPVINTAPTSVQYGESFTVNATSSVAVGSVAFIRLSSTTHSWNMEQRYVPLTYTSGTGGSLSVQAPTNPNTAPPGYYMLFVIDQNKIPSVAKFVRIGGAAGPATNRAPTVYAGPDQSVTLPASAPLNGSVSDDGLPNPPASCTRVWRKVSGPGTVTFGDSLTAQTTATFSAAGAYTLSLTAFDGALSSSDQVGIAVQTSGGGGCTSTLELRVAAGADDAEESAAGSVDIKSGDLEMVYDRNLQTVGMRFTGIDIPQGATITNAWIQFQADEAQTEATSLTIQGQAADAAAAFTTATRNVSTRPRTAASVTWTPGAWTSGQAGAAQRTPDIAPVIQEIVNRSGWSRTALAIIVTGTGHRTAEPFEGGATRAPLLHIEIACAGGNTPPTVNAGTDQTITLPAHAALDGTIQDDGLPNPPGAVTETWSKVSGPGTVTFVALPDLALSASPVRDPDAGPMHAGGHEAVFSDPGTYVLRLTASDGALSASDDVTIVVLPAGGGGGPTTLERSIAAASDDAEESAAGAVDVASSDLELVFDGSLQTVGLRFTGMDIPQGSTITNAWIQFTADEAQTEATTLTIRGHASDNAATFTTATSNLSSRPRTNASVVWSPAAWTVGAAGADQRTPSLTQVIQEIIGRPGWAGQSLALLMTGTGHRTAESYQGSPTQTALLHVEYTPPAAATSPAATLAAEEPATLFTRLGAVFPNPGSGPATVRFELARPGDVQVDLFDIRGALVRRVAGGARGAGFHTESWDGCDRHGRQVPDGVYLLRFAAGPYRETRRLVILRGAHVPSPAR
jgi:galactose oxidase-like protein/flagellar hook capping protein FlgD/K319-like protein